MIVPIILAIVFILLTIECISFSLALHAADTRGIDHGEVMGKLFIPFGFLSIRKMGEIKNKYLAARVEVPFAYVRTCIKWILLYATLYTAIFLLAFTKQNFLISSICVVTFIIFEFVNSSICATIAYKKGMNKFVASAFGFIPIIPCFYYCITNGKKRILPDTVYNTYTFKEVAGRVCLYCELVVLSFIVLVPIIYLLGSSLSNSTVIPSSFWPKGSDITWDNFNILFNQEKITVVNGIEKVTKVYYLFWFKNTFFISLLTMIFSVLIITVTAYIFSRFKFKGQKGGLLFMLILQMFPSFMSLIAIYNLLKMFGLLNNPYALILTYTSGSIPYNVWLIKGFLQNIPKDLDESATIDGANRLQIFFKIILPLILPILTFVAVTQFMAPWLDYILPSYILQADSAEEQKNWTLAVGLFSFIQSPGAELYRPTLFCAGSLIIAIPIATLYTVFQRYLIEGITAGATKG